MLQVLTEELIQIAQLLLGLYFIIKLFIDGLSGKTVTVLFYVFGMATYVIASLYWVVHMLVKSGVTPQFSAVEIGIAGMFLLYGSAINAFRKDIGRPNAGDTAKGRATVRKLDFTSGNLWIFAGAVLFTAANTLCWAGWNGGWIRDIITGIAMGYCLCILVHRLDLADALSQKEWVISGILCFLMMCFEAGTIFTDGRINFILDIARYIVWFAGSAFLALKIREVSKGRPGKGYGKDSGDRSQYGVGCRLGEDSGGIPQCGSEGSSGEDSGEISQCGSGCRPGEDFGGIPQCGSEGSSADESGIPDLRRMTGLGLYYSFMGYMWTAFCMYLSAGVLYQVASVINTLAMIPMYIYIRREAKQA